MKKILFIVLLMVLSLPMAAGIHTYTEQSVLSNGRWVKIRVSESGVCRMTFAQLQEAGLNPRQLRVFGFGGAMLTQDFMQPKIDDLPQVPVYVGSDYVLFWVQGPVSWSYDGTRFAHTRNTYSNYGYYFLTDNTGDLLAPTLAEEITGTPSCRYTTKTPSTWWIARASAEADAISTESSLTPTRNGPSPSLLPMPSAARKHKCMSMLPPCPEK